MEDTESDRLNSPQRHHQFKYAQEKDTEKGGKGGLRFSEGGGGKHGMATKNMPCPL
jgi:hypothetical protein